MEDPLCVKAERRGQMWNLLGIFCIALAQEKIEVTALVGLQYGILK
jgi:hypothetical protein